MATVLIGIDDTDNDDSPGTGQLARRLAGELAVRGAAPLGITRHQFLVDPRIPYTSHNSGACVAVDWDRPLVELRVAEDLIAAWAAEGSDPGVCICPADAVPPAVVAWGADATRVVLEMADAVALAAANGIRLSPLGGSGQGIIGALGSVGLRAGGSDGWFLDLPGLRDLGEHCSAEELAAVGIRVEIAGDVRPAPSARYKTLGWVRPRLIGGRPVWPVQWSDEHDAWIPVDRKRSRPLE